MLKDNVEIERLCNKTLFIASLKFFKISFEFFKDGVIENSHFQITSYPYL
jgi:hypothetical protein